MNTGHRVYADYNATAPLRPEVIAAIAEAQSLTGNPSAIHREGAAARYSVEKARRTIAKAIGATSAESLLFTSGGSEANNLALKGIVDAHPSHDGIKPHVIVSAAEHKSVLDCAKQLERLERISLAILNVDPESRVRVADLRKSLRPETILVSIIHANNEVGSINDIAQLAKATHEGSNALFHTDAVQAVGRVPIRATECEVDLMSISTHKCGGPKGTGVLYRRDGIPLEPLISGGGQESHLRAGTENVAAIAGFAQAVTIATAELAEEIARLVVMRETLWEELRDVLPGIIRLSPITHSLPNTLSISIPGRESRHVIAQLDESGVACSAGSACTSADPEPSHVLKAMGLPPDVASSAIRLSFGHQSTDENISGVAKAFARLSEKKSAI
ncbi:cysteine desulfurase [Candidatus Sumerlaeota bacterium]|nr:cysteine desulfurase [Candidatus Sumerlaeota bacterium]